MVVRYISLCHIKILEGWSTTCSSGACYFDMLGKGFFLDIAIILPRHMTNIGLLCICTMNSECAHISLFFPSNIRYMDIPVISRLYFTGAFLTTAGCALDIISPFSLYFNFDLIFHQGQFWRLITTYLFFGMFSIDFLFHMYFLVSCLITLWIAKYGRLMLLL